MVEGALVNQLAQRHYLFNSRKDNSDYVGQAVIIIGNALHQQELDKMFGINPQLGNSAISYERGTLVLMIINRSSSDIEWRGAV